MVAFALRLGSSESQALDFRDPTVWLASSATGDIVQANANSGEITARIPGLGAPGDSLTLQQVGAGAVVLNRTKGEVVKIDPATQKVAQRAAVPGANTDSVLLARPDELRVVTPSSVYKVDPASGTPGPPINAPKLGHPALDDEGVVWGLDGDRVLGVSDRVNEVHTGNGVQPVAVVGAGGDAFVVDGHRGETELVQLQAKAWRLGDRDCTGGPLPADAALGGTAESGAGVVVAADAAAGLVHVTDTHTGRCASATVKDLTGARFGTPVEAGGFAYLPVLSSAEMLVVRVSDASIAGRYPLLTQANRPIELYVKDGTVWFNQPDGNVAGVLGRDRVVRHINKYDTEGLAAPGGGQPGPTSSTPGTASGGSSNGVTIASPGGSGGDTGAGSGGGSSDTNSVGSAGDAGADAINGSAGGGATQPSEQQNRDGLVADFTFSARRVQVGETVSFSDTSSGEPTAWTWEFGDGAFATGPKASHSWSIPGSFRVTLRVENASATSSASTSIEVVGSGAPSPPKADFRFSSSRVVVGEAVTFTDRSTGKPTDLRWNFGDGTTANGSTATHAWRAAGTYSVTLSATNAQGTDTSPPAVITVFDRVEQPTAIIGGGAPTAKVGQTVFYFSRATGNPTDLKWTFGDGTSATGDVVSHVWSRPGTFTVTLEASNSAGSNTASSTINITEVAQKPEARFVASADRAEENQAVRFTSVSTNAPTRLEWDFGDGTNGTGSNVVHAFRRAGVYTVTLRAENNAGSDSVSQQITIVSQLPAPAAAFTYSPEPPAVITTLTPVRFTDTSTGGAPTSWAWSFDDGTPDSVQQNPVHIFGRTGTFTVRLTVSNSRGSTTTTRSITVAPAPPIADFGWSPTTPRVGQLVQFTDRSVGGEVTSWSWDFGDGVTSTDRNPSHAFATRGTFPVRLTVRNATDVNTRVSNIDVEPPPPVASFDYNPKAPTTATPVTFVNTSTGGPAATVEWDFGDGTKSSAATPPAKTYAAAQDYVVKLRLTNGADVSETTQTIKVTVPAPQASFTVGATRLAGTPVTFTNTSTGGPFVDADIQWDFGDGAKAIGPTPTHAFAEAKAYPVTLTVHNGGGSHSASQTITISPVPVAAFDMNPAANPVANQVVTFTDRSTGGPFAAADIQWHFDDGSTQTGPSVTKAFATTGDHWVTLTVKNAGGGTNTSPQTTIHVRPVAPNPAFTYANAGPGKVTFTGSSGGDPIESWSWNFGDGTALGSGKTVTHDYTGDGPFTVTLTVKNETDTITSPPQTISMATPTVSASVSPAAPTAGQTVTFTNTSTGGPFTSVTWNWGDGTANASGNSATHAFATAGTYKVTLTVTNGNGPASREIEVVVA